MFTNQRWHSRRDAHSCRHALGEADGRVTSKTSGKRMRKNTRHQICKSVFFGTSCNVHDSHHHCEEDATVDGEKGLGLAISVQNVIPNC